VAVIVELKPGDRVSVTNKAWVGFYIGPDLDPTRAVVRARYGELRSVPLKEIQPATIKQVPTI